MMRGMSILLLVVACTLCAHAEPVKPYPLIDWPASDLPWDERPQEEITVFSSRLLETWLAALEQPDVTTRREAADAIGQAHRQGMAQAVKAGGPLLDALEHVEHPILREAIARTLVELDHRSAAEALLALNESGSAQLVVRTDPALARWDYKPARELWLARLVDAGGDRVVRRSAIESLAAVRERRAVDPLLELCGDRGAPAMLRLPAADALARLAGGRVVVAAEALLQRDPGMLDRLMAVRLLARHDSDASRALLMTLADDPLTVVAAPALERLVRIDPVSLSDRIESLMTSPDARIRRVAARVLDAAATPEAMRLLARMLADPNPGLRAGARLRLHGADSDPQLRDTMREAVMEQLWSNASSAVVEAAVLLGRLDHQPAASRLVELLNHRRHEVRLAAIVALRWLRNEQTYGYLSARAVRVANALLHERDRSRSVHRGYSVELQQLIQTFGVIRYERADPWLRMFINPYSRLSGGTRSSAIWALGQIHDGKPDPQLCDALVERLMDVRARWSERHEVRMMSAMAIGMMGAEEYAPILRQFSASSGADPGIMQACRWAIERIGGEPAQPPPPSVRASSGWFLEPIDP